MSDKPTVRVVLDLDPHAFRFLDAKAHARGQRVGEYVAGYLGAAIRNTVPADAVTLPAGPEHRRPRKPRRELSSADLATMYRLADEGVKGTAIALQLGVAYNTVKRRLRDRRLAEQRQAT